MLCGGLDGRGVWGRMDTHKCVSEFLCYSPETISGMVYRLYSNTKWMPDQSCLILSKLLDWRLPGSSVWATGEAHQFSSVQLLSHVRLFATPRCSTPGLSVHHHLLEFTQTDVHWVSDTIQPSHPLFSTSPPSLNLSQHQGLFKWVSSSHQVAKISGSPCSNIK